jgi:hypothetical protein
MTQEIKLPPLPYGIQPITATQASIIMDYVRAAVALNAPAWQPIETAPKDETAIWVLDTLHGKPWYYECIWNGIQWYHGFGDAWPKANPTHWMPLPSLPAGPKAA